MAKVYAFLADGCEEVEALTSIDFLRRAGHDVVGVSIMDELLINGSNGIQFLANEILDEMSDEELSGGDLFFLPGGGVGTQNLKDCSRLGELLIKWNAAGKKIAAICAAPTVLGGLGLLKRKKATCYPGCESDAFEADFQAVPAVTDGNITTGRGPGASIDFALELIRVLDGEEKRAEIKAGTVFAY